VNAHDAAMIRGWIQGVAWDVLGELYLNDADRTDVIRAVRQLREKLACKARRLGFDADAALWGREREYSQDWMQRALKSVDELKSKPDPKPQPSDSFSRWLPQNISTRLSGIKKVSSLQELANFINQKGSGWWKTVPHLGKQSAETIQAFFELYEPDLGIRLDLSHRNLASAVSYKQSNGIVPLERFSPPIHLTGETGSNRAPIERCRIEARNDYQSILAWLSLWDDETPTHRAYRKEAERFLLWAVIEKGKPLSSITTPDCAEYRRFLADPQPVDRWIGKPAQRWSSEWRPLKGPLKPSSIRQAEVILSSLCEWLVGQRYLDSNPFSGLSTQSFGRRSGSTDRALSPALWEQVNAFAENQAQNESLTEGQRTAYRRTSFILKFAYHTGLRLHEMAKANIGDLRQVTSIGGDQCWLDVIGKGKKHREVPISPGIIEAINNHLRDRGLRAVGYTSADTPIIGKLRGEAKDAISESGLYQALKDFFEEVARVLEDKDPLAADKLKRASTHWLRHTHGSHAVANGVPLAIVRDNLGHSNIATTSIYVHTDRDERYKAMLNMGKSQVKTPIA
jgi:integrase